MLSEKQEAILVEVKAKHGVEIFTPYVSFEHQNPKHQVLIDGDIDLDELRCLVEIMERFQKET